MVNMSDFLARENLSYQSSLSDRDIILCSVMKSNSMSCPEKYIDHTLLSPTDGAALI